jgi:hypothetical protein
MHHQRAIQCGKSRSVPTVECRIFLLTVDLSPRRNNLAVRVVFKRIAKLLRIVVSGYYANGDLMGAR